MSDTQPRTELQEKYKLFARTSSPLPDYTRPHRKAVGCYCRITGTTPRQPEICRERRYGNASENIMAAGVAGAVARYGRRFACSERQTDTGGRPYHSRPGAAYD